MGICQLEQDSHCCTCPATFLWYLFKQFIYGPVCDVWWVFCILGGGEAVSVCSRQVQPDVLGLYVEEKAYSSCSLHQPGEEPRIVNILGLAQI